tara:strand:- start:222 stop:746 length:525 start_codon:yes stop_codon:yes gene_type:complete
MSIKTIFLDRDGVINKDIGYLYEIDKFEFVSGIFPSCRHFINLGYSIIIVSNQSGIDRGFYSEKDYQIVTKWMIDQFSNNGIKILDALHCPHGPDSNCICRKPLPGMFLESQRKYDIDMELSWMIGDKETDILGARAAGIKQSILIDTNHINNRIKSSALHIINSISDSIPIIC